MNTILQKGDMILFFRGDTWLSKSISYLTGAEVTHASMVYSEDSIIEILAGGVQITKIALKDSEQDAKKAYLMRHIPELDFQPLKDSADAYLNADIKYDFTGLYLLGGLLIYKKFVPSPRFLNCTGIILEAGLLLLNRFIRKEFLHDSGKAMVCSQFIYQLFYDCGGDYRIPIVDGCLSVNNRTNKPETLLTPKTCPTEEICLADLLALDMKQDMASMEEDNDLLFTVSEADIDSPSFMEDVAKELYFTLTGSSSESENDTATAANGLFAKSTHINHVLSLARKFLDKSRQLQEKIGLSLPLDAMFVTVADLAYHAPSLQKIDTVYVKRL